MCGASPVSDWHAFERAVRDGTVTKAAAAARLGPIVSALHAAYAGVIAPLPARWTFPVAGYDARAINRHDFRPNIRYGPGKVKGYDFFDGNRHGGHPAYDVFIRDRDRDCVDDRTGKPAPAVAMTDAVVISVCREWETDKNLRGGNYAWLYNPDRDTFLYYAHLHTVTVEEGQVVKAGDTVGTVGRSGVLAARAASPTHVHLMALMYDGTALRPFRYYQNISTRKG